MRCACVSVTSEQASGSVHSLTGDAQTLKQSVYAVSVADGYLHQIVITGHAVKYDTTNISQPLPIPGVLKTGIDKTKDT